MIERLNAALEGRYRIERELGEGGMARMYLAEDLKHHRKVAVKVLRRCQPPKPTWTPSKSRSRSWSGSTGPRR